jgi:16S rRNA (guanine527-N7)-methyltransferase
MRDSSSASGLALEAELASRYGLPEDACAQLSRLLDRLVDDPLAPTALRDRRRALDDHLADSLVALELDAVRSATRAADLGSGAGLPGLALAIAMPHVDFVLVESVGRKCEFIERAAAECGLSNVTVRNARAEDLPPGGFDLVTARALAALPVVAEYAAPLLDLGGSLVAWRGQRDPEAELEAEAAAEVLGLVPGEIRRVEPYPGAQSRHLHLMSKVRATPARFPRRPGIAVKRPLGRDH